MQIESIQLKNFRAFKDMHMRNIPRFCVIVGANGAGKSTLFRVFGFLKDALTDNLQVAFTKLGGSRGFEEVRSRNTTGPIQIELKFREADRRPLITYSLKINEENGKIVIEEEVLQYRRGQKGKPWRYLDFKRGTGTAITNEFANVTNESELSRVEQTLKSSDILAIKGLAQFQDFPAVKALGDLIENWHISDFHIQSVGAESRGYANHLSPDADNLPLVIEHLHKNYPEIFHQILKKLSERIPGISTIEPKMTEEGRILLKFRDGAFKEPFLSPYVSDGTIKMLAYLVLLYDPEPHPLLCVEEPENQLYPKLLAELAEEFRSYAHRGEQVFVSTHSPDFLNAIELSEVFYLVKRNGYSEIQRAKENKQIKTYVDAGDSIGALWREGFFEGVDP